MAPEVYKPRLVYNFFANNFAPISDCYELTLTNTQNILIEPFTPTIVPIGIKIIKCPKNLGCFLYGHSNKAVCCHLGVIDPGYTGELKLIIWSTTASAITILAKELQVSIVPFNYITPNLSSQNLLSHPHYLNDVGYDLHLPEDITIFPMSSKRIYIFKHPPHVSKLYTAVVLGRSGLAINGTIVTATKWTSNFLEIKLTNYSNSLVYYAKGTKICQITFIHNKHLLSPNTHTTKSCTIGTSVFSGSKICFVEDKNVNQNENYSCVPTQKIECQQVRGDSGFGSSDQ
ncbi:ORF54 [Felid gammaherpesvirus 1]|uniref:ORF54 n=1 Tax=Felid gammaherpesvirus 1 TaxID=2560468 RepID=A0A0M4M4I9_9GAMA|nr:ORF54 [Felis catus gammaherpesvirus 1]ALE14768.1 ORF54 [Felis catus gammaherpesvirus 1]